MTARSQQESRLQLGSGALQTFNTAQLRPAKSLPRHRHPSILRPGTSFQGARSDSSAGNSPIEQFHIPNVHSGEQHPASVSVGQSRAISHYGDKQASKRVSYTSPKPQKPYIRSPSHGDNTPCPVSTYSAYRPPAAQPNQRPRSRNIRNSVSLPETPSTYYSDYASEDNDACSVYSTASYSFTPRPANDHVSRRGAQSAPQVMTRVNGVKFEMISAHASPSSKPVSTPIPVYVPTRTDTPAPARAQTPAPPSAPIPTPSISSTPSRGRRTSISSFQSQSRRSPSPAYGAWESDDPQAKQLSFFQRVQEGLESSLHEQLVKAGLRPPRSFNVLKVEKVSSGNNTPVQREDGRESAVSASSGQSRPTAPTPPAQKKQSWDISSGSDDGEAELSYAHGGQSQCSRRFSFTPLQTNGRVPNLYVKNNTENGSVPVGAAQPQVFAELETPFETPATPAPFNGTGDVSRSYYSGAIDDSLSYQFAQRCQVADAERNQQNQYYRSVQPPSPSHSSQHQEYQGEKYMSNNNYSSRPQYSRPPSREQIQFAALPSPAADLGRPFPFDDRYDLPSRASQQDQSRRRTLNKKKGMQLR
ncbi:hypothetical protein F4678DRAFT_365970 [Xylaria arbuscula]|nr:hypothetical protein F4678DRAFT_365970 [Xylaria arbuscula]